MIVPTPLREFFYSFKDYYSPPALDVTVDDIFQAIEDVFYDFGLYSDKPSIFGTYQLPVLPRSRPLIAGGWLKIQLNTALLPRGVLLQDIMDPTLLTALKSALDTNVEIVHEESQPLAMSTLSEIAQPAMTPIHRGILPWRRSMIPNPEKNNVWIRVELERSRLRGIPRFVDFDDLPEPDTKHYLSWPVGIVHGDAAYYADFPTEVITMFVCGATRQGKSTHIRAGVKFLQQYYADEYYQLIIGDFKDDQTDYAHLINQSNVTFSNSVSDLLQHVDHLNKHRGQLRRQSKTFNIFQHNDLAETTSKVPHIPYCLVIIDEMYLFKLFANKDQLQLLQTLVATTASNGIYWLIGTQRPSTDIIGGATKTNFHTRMSYSLPTSTDGDVVFGSQQFGESVVRLGCPGRAFVLIGDRFFEFQSAYA